MSADSISLVYTEAGSEIWDTQVNDDRSKNRVLSLGTFMHLLYAQVLGLKLRSLKCLNSLYRLLNLLAMIKYKIKQVYMAFCLSSQ